MKPQTKQEDDPQAVGRKKCKCGMNDIATPHTCPFKQEIHNDNSTLCTCCEACEHECLSDI